MGLFVYIREFRRSDVSALLRISPTQSLRLLVSVFSGGGYNYLIYKYLCFLATS